MTKLILKFDGSRWSTLHTLRCPLTAVLFMRRILTKAQSNILHVYELIETLNDEHRHRERE